MTYICRVLQIKICYAYVMYFPLYFSLIHSLTLLSFFFHDLYFKPVLVHLLRAKQCSYVRHILKQNTWEIKLRWKRKKNTFTYEFPPNNESLFTLDFGTYGIFSIYVEYIKSTFYFFLWMGYFIKQTANFDYHDQLAIYM